jgi:hypothetical protein
VALRESVKIICKRCEGWKLNLCTGYSKKVTYIVTIY